MQNSWTEIPPTFTCAGVIVINKEFDKCIIVITPNGKNIGFPKGKINKVKGIKENVFQCAERELFEETGLKFSQLKFVNNICLNEMSNKGIVSIVYLVAVYIDEIEHKFVYDKEELSYSGWKLIDEMNEHMWKDRKDLLNIAHSIVTNEKCIFVYGDGLEN